MFTRKTLVLVMIADVIWTAALLALLAWGDPVWLVFLPVFAACHMLHLLRGCGDTTARTATRRRLLLAFGGALGSTAIAYVAAEALAPLARTVANKATSELAPILGRWSGIVMAYAIFVFTARTVVWACRSLGAVREDVGCLSHAG